jgi:hypothetical protein
MNWGTSELRRTRFCRIGKWFPKGASRGVILADTMRDAE